MKKLVLLFLMFFTMSNIGFSQDNEECITNLQIFAEHCKKKRYEEAYTPWKKVRTDCPPAYNINVYTLGEKILKDKIKKASADQKLTFATELESLYDDYLKAFPNKSKKGDVLSDKAMLLYEFKSKKGLSDSQVYDAFDLAYTSDAKTFTNPKGLYTYFKLMVQLYDAKLKPAEDLFTKYDEIHEKVESEIKNYTQKLNAYLPGEDGVEKVLSSKDKARKKYYESYLKAYDQISLGMDKDLGDRANCANLIPLYERNYEANKNDGLWLQRAMNRLYAKECSDSELFFKIVQQKNVLEPNASTAYYLGILKDKEGKSNDAITYYKQAVELETDAYEKAKILYRVAEKFKAKGSYSIARSYYRKALSSNASMGKCYIKIAEMYAKSANNCGATAFDKRAVYWLAASEVVKAGRADAKLKKTASRYEANYKAKAPSKGEIFSANRAGETINIACWIGAKVKVPEIK